MSKIDKHYNTYILGKNPTFEKEVTYRGGKNVSLPPKSSDSTFVGRQWSTLLASQKSEKIFRQIAVDILNSKANSLTKTTKVLAIAKYVEREADQISRLPWTTKLLGGNRNIEGSFKEVQHAANSYLYRFWTGSEEKVSAEQEKAVEDIYKKLHSDRLSSEELRVLDQEILHLLGCSEPVESAAARDVLAQFFESKCEGHLEQRLLNTRLHQIDSKQTYTEQSTSILKLCELLTQRMEEVDFEEIDHLVREFTGSGNTASFYENLLTPVARERFQKKEFSDISRLEKNIAYQWSRSAQQEKNSMSNVALTILDAFLGDLDSRADLPRQTRLLLEKHFRDVEIPSSPLSQIDFFRSCSINLGTILEYFCIPRHFDELLEERGAQFTNDKYEHSKQPIYEEMNQVTLVRLIKIASYFAKTLAERELIPAYKMQYLKDQIALKNFSEADVGLKQICDDESFEENIREEASRALVLIDRLKNRGEEQTISDIYEIKDLILENFGEDNYEKVLVVLGHHKIGAALYLQGDFKKAAYTGMDIEELKAGEARIAKQRKSHRSSH